MMIENHIRRVGEVFPDYGVEYFDMLTDKEKQHYAFWSDMWVNEVTKQINYPLELTDSQRKLYAKCLQWEKDNKNKTYKINEKANKK